MDLQKELKKLMNEVIKIYSGRVQPNDIFVLGCSTSEIAGGQIGKNSQPEFGYIVVQEVLEGLKPLKLNLAVQGCEHINRSLVVEKKVALEHNLDIVSVVPALDAGGGTAVAAYQLFKEPVMVEFVLATSGLDIGETHIGMHVKHVQIPMRFSQTYIGEARVNGLTSRPKLIGGVRAQY